MPLLFVLLVAAASLQIPWPEPPFGPADDPAARVEGAVVASAAVLAVPPAAAAALTGWVVVTLRRDRFRRPAVAHVYGRARRLMRSANLFAVAVAVGGCGWGWVVWHGLPALAVEPFDGPPGSAPVLAPGAELLVPAPYFLLIALSWVIYYPAERVLHDTAATVEVAVNRPAFWSLPGFVLYHARQFGLLVLAPAAAFALQQGATRALPALAAAGWLQLGWLAVVAGMMVAMPWAVKPALGLVSLPAGPARDRLEATARRLGFTYSDLLLWPTRGTMTNAMVLGLVPWARYVVFTDQLLDGLDPDELDAVLGHEAGHVRHHHIPFYAGFITVSAATVTATVVAAERLLADGDGWTAAGEWWEALPPVALMGAYLFVVFGLLSRRCERQADVYGCRAGSCGNPRCGGHHAGAVLLPAGRGLCPTGVQVLVRALEKVAILNGMDRLPVDRPSLRRRALALARAWQHGPIPDRIEFLFRLAADPSLGDRTDRGVNRFRWTLLATLVGLAAGLGSVVGWDELWRML